MGEEAGQGGDGEAGGGDGPREQKSPRQVQAEAGRGELADTETSHLLRG